MKAVDSNQFLTTIKFAASNQWSWRCLSHCSLSWEENFLVSELRIPSNSRSCWKPNRVKTLTVFVSTLEKPTMQLDYVCMSSWVEIHQWLLQRLRSDKLLAENVTGLKICLWAETQSRNCSFCLTNEANLQTKHLLSIAQPFLMQNDIENFYPLGPLQGVSWEFR